MAAQLFNFLFIYSLYLSHQVFGSHPSPSLSLPQNKTKRNLREKKWGVGERENLIMKSALCHSESHSKPFSYTCSFTGRSSPQRTVGLVGGPCPLLHHWHWTLSGTLPGHSAVALCCGDPAAPNPQDWPHSPVIWQITDGVGQP